MLDCLPIFTIATVGTRDNFCTRRAASGRATHRDTSNRLDAPQVHRIPALRVGTLLVPSIGVTEHTFAPHLSHFIRNLAGQMGTENAYDSHTRHQE